MPQGVLPHSGALQNSGGDRPESGQVSAQRLTTRPSSWDCVAGDAASAGRHGHMATSFGASNNGGTRHDQRPLQRPGVTQAASFTGVGVAGGRRRARRARHLGIGDHGASGGFGDHRAIGRTRCRGQGHRLPRLRGWTGWCRLGRSDPDRLHQPGRRVDRRQRRSRRRCRLRRPVHQRAGRRHRRPPDRDRPVLHRQRRGRGPAVRPGVRQRRLDRRCHQRSDGHGHAVVLRRARRVQAGGPRRVGEPGRHHPAERRRAQRRCGVHPRPVRLVRRRRARRRVGGADLLGGDAVRCRRRAGVGVRDPRHPDRGRAVPAEHARPHRPAARRGRRTPTS